MAEVLTLDKEKKSEGAGKKIENFMTRNRKFILCIGLVLVLGAIAACVCVGVMDSQKKSALEVVDKIEYTYSKDFDSLSEEEIVARQTAALDSLKDLLGKKGVVGVRANMLAADICFAKKDFVNSMDYWVAAAKADEKSYTAPICYYNAGVCYEETGDNKTAASYYQMAADNSKFLLTPRALMGIARVKEADGDFAGAAEMYNKLVDSYSSNDWTDLAQSRLIRLSLEGKIN